MQLVLVVSDCPLPPDPAEAGGLDVPPLPALSLLLARGSAAGGTGSWQQRLLAGASAPGMARLSVAEIASGALSEGPRAGAWLAQPVHLQAATDHLRLPADGLLRLDAAAAQALCADFARVFGADGYALHALRDGGLLLTGCEAATGLPEPSRQVGERLEPARHGVDPLLRRLASEIELWLHEHPVNRARAGRGEPTVSALWLWGGERGAGEPAETGAPRRIDAMFGSDPFVLGLARQLALACAAPPAHLDALPAPSGAAAVLVQVSLRDAKRAGQGGLAAIEAAWIAPALARLRAGTLSRLRLLMLDSEVESTRLQTWKLWRRRRPWWDTLRR
jgi:hypothetical protein